MRAERVDSPFCAHCKARRTALLLPLSPRLSLWTLPVSLSFSFSQVPHISVDSRGKRYYEGRPFLFVEERNHQSITAAFCRAETCSPEMIGYFFRWESLKRCLLPWATPSSSRPRCTGANKRVFASSKQYLDCQELKGKGFACPFCPQLALYVARYALF